MRLFTAIDLPAETLDRLESLLTRLRPLARLKWSPLSNLHITTKFIGDWPEQRLPELLAALNGIGSRPAVPVHVRGLGFHPNSKSPHVFYAGVDSSQELAALARDIDSALAKIDLEPESRPYSPHLTLARIKTRRGLASFYNEVNMLGQPDFGAFTADRFFLYHSKTAPSGSVYTKLSDFPILKE